MTLRLSEVLAEEGLSLRLAGGEPGLLERPVRWVAITELDDPQPFLTGGELVLTTGLRQRSARTQAQFVARVAACRAAGLGFGTGLTHRRIPAGTLTCAADHGLPVLEIPYSTPFAAVDRFVAGRVLGDRYGRYAGLLEEHDALARSLLSGRGLGALVTMLHHILGAPASVVDVHGSVLEASPPGTTHTAPMTLPVTVEESVVAHLCCDRPSRSADVLPYAVSLVGLELARRQAELAGRRRLAGQVLQDLVRGIIGAPEAERRLAPFGIRAADEHALIAATVDTGESLRRLVGSPPLADAATAIVENNLIAVLSPGSDAPAVARELHARLTRTGDAARVGVGGWYTGMTGLRWSYYEAHEAMNRGPGVNGREQLSVSGLLLASEDVPLRDLARDVLRPLREFDEAHAGALVATLRAYLDANGAVAAVAGQLIVHRNTVRYRLAQIERLTGRSLTSTADRVQLWLALAAARLDGSAAGRPDGP